MGLDNNQENQGNPRFPRIRQLPPTVYRSVQQDSQTTIGKEKKRMHQQLGVGRHGTKSIRRTKDKAHHSTSTGLFQPSHTNQHRNCRLKICLLRHIISTMPGREIEISGIPIQDNVERPMQLQYTR